MWEEDTFRIIGSWRRIVQARRRQIGSINPFSMCFHAPFPYVWI